MNIRFSRGFSLFGRNKKKCDFTPDIKLLSHFQSTYFTPALEKHKAGDYKGAIVLYGKAVSEGSQIACFNLGLYYLFGVGVAKDTDKFVDLWILGGKINPNHVNLFRLLSNISLFPDLTREVTCLFISIHCFIVHFSLFP